MEKIKYTFKEVYGEKIVEKNVTFKQLEILIYASDFQNIPKINNLREYFKNPLVWKVDKRETIK